MMGAADGYGHSKIIYNNSSIDGIWKIQSEKDAGKTVISTIPQSFYLKCNSSQHTNNTTAKMSENVISNVSTMRLRDSRDTY